MIRKLICLAALVALSCGAVNYHSVVARKKAGAAGGIGTPISLDTAGLANTSSGSVTLDASAATEGSLLVAALVCRSLEDMSTAASGWTLLGSIDSGSASNTPDLHVYYKTAGASEGTHTWTWTANTYDSGALIEIPGGTGVGDVASNTGDILGVITPGAGDIVISISSAGTDADSTIFSVSNGSYTILNNYYGTRRSGVSMAYADLGSGATNGTDTHGSGNTNAVVHAVIQD